jgi:hypothetical protein
MIAAGFILISCGGDGESDEPHEQYSSAYELNDSLESDSLSLDTTFALADEFESVFETNYGTGVIVFDFKDGDNLELYPPSPSKAAGHPFIMYPDKILSIAVADYELDLGDDDWKMFAFWPEYDLVHAICLKQYPDQKMNLIRYNEDKSYGISDSVGKYYGWLEYLNKFALSVEPIKVNGLYDGSIMDAPTENANHIEEESDYLNAWKPVAMKGEWIKVDIYNGPCQEEEVYKTGWIKWRNDRTILIEISYIC